MATKTPDYIKQGEGFTDITLSRAATLNGTKTTVLRMREPTVGDSEAASEMTGSDATREIFAFANLCGVTPNDLRALPLKDFRRIQTAYLGFTD